LPNIYGARPWYSSGSGRKCSVGSGGSDDSSGSDGILVVVVEVMEVVEVVVVVWTECRCEMSLARRKTPNGLYYIVIITIILRWRCVRSIR